MIQDLVIMIFIFCFSCKMVLCTSGVHYSVKDIKRATALQTIHVNVSAPTPRLMTLECLSKCNQYAACRAVNIFDHSICEILVSPILSVADVAGNRLYTREYRCPDGFGYSFELGSPHLNGWVVPSCYKFVKTPKQWQAARNHCGLSGADLVSIETAEEQSHIQTIIQSMGSRGPWFASGNDEDREGVWYWKATDAAFTYTAWYHGRADIHAGYNCLLMVLVDWLRWDDTSCISSFPFICEFSAF